MVTPLNTSGLPTTLNGSVTEWEKIKGKWTGGAKLPANVFDFLLLSFHPIENSVSFREYQRSLTSTHCVGPLDCITTYEFDQSNVLYVYAKHQIALLVME